MIAHRDRTPPRRIATIALAASLLLASASCSTEGLRGRVVGVSDGDTITVLREGHEQTSVRLEGIDCPERGQPYGQQAKALTSRLVFGRDVLLLLGKDRDQYGRLVARVVVNGRDVCVELVRAGLAWHYKRYSSDPTLAHEEATARAERRGLWADARPAPPWEWRAMKWESQRLRRNY